MTHDTDPTTRITDPAVLAAAVAEGDSMMFHELVADYTETCFACPAQYEGTLKDGRAFYFRYRFGWASLKIGDEDSVGMAYGDDMGGVLSVDEFQTLFVGLMMRRTPPLRRFAY